MNTKHEPLTGKFVKSHGMSYTRTYKTWISMNSRCYNPMETGYRNWGGRGIQVCEKWRNSFEEFYNDMGFRPKNMSLDRIDNDGNYEPNNCKWSTKAEQNLNKRMQSNNKSGHVGIIWNRKAKKWQAMFKGEYLGLHISIEEAKHARQKRMEADGIMG